MRKEKCDNEARVNDITVAEWYQLIVNEGECYMSMI